MDPEIDHIYAEWSREARLLADIGRYVFPQHLSVAIRLPRELAERAVEAWSREEDASAHIDTSRESDEEREGRHRAGTLALIGLSIEQRGRVDGDEVVVPLDAWFIGDALRAADDADLLQGLRPPTA